jgi:beta-phosphoglucomutase-like phosphatase (HAD superfamily)
MAEWADEASEQGWRALKRLRLESRHAIAVEDTLQGVKAAQAAGLPCSRPESVHRSGSVRRRRLGGLRRGFLRFQISGLAHQPKEFAIVVGC